MKELLRNNLVGYGATAPNPPYIEPWFGDYFGMRRYLVVDDSARGFPGTTRRGAPGTSRFITRPGRLPGGDQVALAVANKIRPAHFFQRLP
jgi:hypothetical protein